jgi:hypothetical protein
MDADREADDRKQAMRREDDEERAGIFAREHLLKDIAEWIRDDANHDDEPDHARAIIRARRAIDEVSMK